MDRNTKILILVGIVVLCVLISIVYFKCNKQNEKFSSDCYNCGEFTRRECSKCLNCGWCITADGHRSCVQGSPNGPLFRDDCQFYQYVNPTSTYGTKFLRAPYQYGLDWYRTRRPHILYPRRFVKINFNIENAQSVFSQVNK